MLKTLQILGPIFAGVVLWDVVPGLVAKLVLLCTATAFAAGSLLMKQSGKRGRIARRMAGGATGAAIWDGIKTVWALVGEGLL